MNLTPEQTASQLRCPHGEAGAELGQSMNLRNLTQTLSAYAAARITHGNRILDIGCGNGGLLGYILSQADNLHYTGLEISPLMVERRVKPSIFSTMARSCLSRTIHLMRSYL